MRIFKLAGVAIIALFAVYFYWQNYRPVTTVTIMTFNIENGGTQVSFDKVVEVIHKAKADVVGLQEAWGNTSKLAKALGWKYYNNRQHIISRYPLFEPKDGRSVYTLIEVKPGYVVAMANIHLPDDPYGPDLIRNGASATKVEAIESKVRLPTALPPIQKLATLAQRGVPVFLTGDFNSPSHLDWSRHHVAVAWPVTKTAEKSGLKDAYRAKHPNFVKDPAVTWPSNRPHVTTTSFDGFNPSEDDPHDRIDFIFTGGRTKVIEASIDKFVQPWPSDHHAVVAHFEVRPVTLSSFTVKPNAIKLDTLDKPSISTVQTSFKVGEPITINWRNTPGNRYDYIMIVPANSKKTGWGEAVRLYTHGEVNGSLVYDQHSVKGNWLDWHKMEDSEWPMKPGKYDIRLMLDDSNVELARKTVVVK